MSGVVSPLVPFCFSVPVRASSPCLLFLLFLVSCLVCCLFSFSFLFPLLSPPPATVGVGWGARTSFLGISLSADLSITSGAEAAAHLLLDSAHRPSTLGDCRPTLPSMPLLPGPWSLPPFFFVFLCSGLMFAGWLQPLCAHGAYPPRLKPPVEAAQGALLEWRVPRVSLAEKQSQ